MSEGFVLYCSPTLAGIKTGSLFSEAYDSECSLMRKISHMEALLSPKGVHIVVLKRNMRRALIYVYRLSALERDLMQKEAQDLLREKGYLGQSVRELIIELADRLNDGSSFPHEIGLFLGYPIEDIRGFIDNRAANFKLCGCWKVYGDEQAARKRFSTYDKCKNIYYRNWKAGKPLEQMVVSK